MSFDPFTEETIRSRPSAHEIGQDVGLLSLHELDERVALLEREVVRLKKARAAKEDFRAAAGAIFKLASASPDSRP